MEKQMTEDLKKQSMNALKEFAKHKNSYENMDAYVGKKIKFSGFVYRLYDFKS